MTISVPRSDDEIVTEDKQPTFLFSQFMLDVEKLSPIVGSGSPEGSVEASQWQTYIDEDALTGAIKYIKKHQSIGGDATKGWILQ